MAYGNRAVSTRTMLGAKLANSAIPFGASLAIAMTILVASEEATPLIALECLLVGLGAFALWVCLGMSIDVRSPNLSWMNPQDVVKRGAPVNVCILGGLVYTFAAGASVFRAVVLDRLGCRPHREHRPRRQSHLDWESSSSAAPLQRPLRFTRRTPDRKGEAIPCHPQSKRMT